MQNNDDEETGDLSDKLYMYLPAAFISVSVWRLAFGDAIAASRCGLLISAPAAVAHVRIQIVMTS